MSDIFISYAREDRDRAKALAEALQARGWTIWWDRFIPSGKTFDEVIEREIDATKCIVVLWSKASITSRWVRTEAAEGADRGILIPVLIDDARIPLAFRRIQAADLSAWDLSDTSPTFQRLVDDIRAVVGPATDAGVQVHLDATQHADTDTELEAAAEAEDELSDAEAVEHTPRDTAPAEPEAESPTTETETARPPEDGDRSTASPSVQSGFSFARGCLIPILMVAAQLGTIVMIGMVLWGLANNSLTVTIGALAAAVGCGLLVWKLSRS